MSGFHDKDALMKRLGKYSTGKSCLSIKRLEGIDVEVLRELMSCSVAAIREKSG